MSEPQRPRFRHGPNIAIKMPPGEYERLVAFYRETLGFTAVDEQEGSVAFAFGSMRLWIDRVPALSQGEVWLQLKTPDTGVAAAWLEQQGAQRRDDIEALPSDLDAFWISAPGGMIHLVSRDNAT